MLIFNKVKNFFYSVFPLKFNDLRSLLGKYKDCIKKIRVKLNDLSKTNLDLGIYHLNKGNLNDAILRFKLVKQFSNNKYEDLDYFLGRCYLEKLKYDKAKILFENYATKDNPKFLEEAKYCLNIINGEVHNIKLVPTSIVTHKLSQQFDLCVKATTQALKNKDDPKNIMYKRIKEALENNKKVFDYNMLDLGCNLGLVAYLLREDQLLHFLLGIEINNSMAEYCKQLTISSSKVYNTVINQDIETFLASKAQTDSKFDIILGANLITYSTNLNFLFTKLKTYINENGIMAFSFFVKEQEMDYVFDCQSESFIYNKDYVSKIAEECDWQVINHEKVQSSKDHHPQITMILELKKG